jgi:hypothetical protein
MWQKIVFVILSFCKSTFLLIFWENGLQKIQDGRFDFSQKSIERIFLHHTKKKIAATAVAW